MGTSWSEEGKGSSSQQQAHQPAHYPEPEPIASPKPKSSFAPCTSRPDNRLLIEPTPTDVTRELKLPHNCEVIIKDSDSPIDKSSQQKVYQQLHAGVYLYGRSKKYWVDKKGNNCFMVFANGLKITWAENPAHWCLLTAQTSDQGQITIAQLINVAWLEVHGRLHTSILSPGVTYQVAFLIMLEYTSYGWDTPVNFRLTLPNGTKQEHKENLKDKPKGEWLRVPVGEIKASPENVGEIEFSLYEYEGGNWKKGLVVKCAIIEPKY